jgi:branched-chain amino acid transport system ATP-binding protein
MLELKNINAGYGSFQALFDVSLSIQAGEAVAVIGPNGAGKTTLLRVISRLIEASAGDMHMEGLSYRSLPSHEVVGLGIAQVPEGRRLFPRLSVEDNLKMGAYTPAARARRDEKLDYVYDLFPRMAEAQTIGGHHVWRGTANVCHWPSPDEWP